MERWIKLVNGVEVEMTPEEVTERQAEESAPLPPLPIALQLDAIFNQLPEEAQADLAPLKAAVKLELESGRVNIARLIIERTSVTEYQALKEAMLAVFNG